MIGKVQIEVLKSLIEFNGWNDSGRSGWVWNTTSGTKKIMESLVRRGLVQKQKAEFGYDYAITKAGRAIIGKDKES